MSIAIGRAVAAGTLLVAVIGGGACSQSGGDNSGPAPTGPSKSASDPNQRSSQFQAIVDTAMLRNQIPAAVVRITTPAGSWQTATGLADIKSQRPVTVADRFAIRSITKSMTVTVVLQLVGDNLAKLDDPISTYVTGVPNGGKITLRQLAGMRSGLPDYSKSKAFIAKLIKDPTRAWTNQQLLTVAFAQPVLFAPGAKYDYSNTNTILLGEVIQKLTGHSWDYEITNRITGPAAELSTSYPGTGLIPEPAALGYATDDGKPEQVQLSFTSLAAAGGLVSALDDLERWGVQLGTGSLIGDRLQAERTAEASPVTSGPEYDKYGLGIGEIDGWWGHTGSGIGYQCLVMYNAATNTTVTILLNAANTPDTPAKLFKAVVAELRTLG